MTVLAGMDLDRTLIFSRGALRTYGHGEAPLVAVERHHGADSAWMTEHAAEQLAALRADQVQLVPVTTRTVKQLHRVQLPVPAPAFAVAANGGVLLVDGRADVEWDRRIRQRLAGVASLEEVRAQAERVCRPEWTKVLRTAEGMFCYAVLFRGLVPPGMVDDSMNWARQRGWRVSLQGRKLYWVPVPLSKAAALAEIRRRAGAARLLAAGDSLLDADLLATADRAIMARHGELFGSGWSAAHVDVTRSRGVLAGEEIVAWLHEQV